MSAPSLDGSFVFGGAVQVAGPQINARRQQRVVYPGLRGVQSIDMGDAGLTTEISGRLGASSAAGLASAFGAIYAFYDGNTHTFIDSDGTTWTNVVLESVERVGRKERDGNGLWTQRYTCRLFHLTTS